MNTHAPPTIYEHMQAAIDIVATSPHPTNKVAATLTHDDWIISLTNQWPAPIAQTIGTHNKIGNSSGTIHAETACILQAPKKGHTTSGATLFVTDPPCPNCMKNIAEAGIANIYIDHKGFDKDWARRRGDKFESMSMRTAEKAGIDVHVIHRKERRFETISSHVPGYKPTIESPPIIKECTENFKECIKRAHAHFGDEPFALALAKDQNGQSVSLLTDRHPTIGYTYKTVESKQEKYSFILQPIARILMSAARSGLILDNNNIYSSRVPTSREMVNFIGAGLSALTIGDLEAARDEYGPIALKQLTDSGLLETKILSISSS